MGNFISNFIKKTTGIEIDALGEVNNAFATANEILTGLPSDIQGLDIDLIESIQTAGDEAGDTIEAAFSGLEYEISHFEQDLPKVDLNPFDAGESFEVNVNATFEDINSAILDDPFGTIGTIALLMIPGGAPAWAFALNSGASAAYRGGSPEDVVKAMGLSYVGSQIGDVVSNQTSQYLQGLTNEAGEMLLDETVQNAFAAGSERFATSLIHSEGDVEAALKDAAVGATLTGVAKTLGKIDDTLGETGSSFTNVAPAVKQAISASVVAVIEGEDIGEAALNGLVRGYTESIIPAMQDIIDVDLVGDTGLSDTNITLLTNALSSSLEAAIKGGADPTDAFFASFKVEANERIKTWINSNEGLNVAERIDSLFGDSQELSAATQAVSAARTLRAEGMNAYNAIAEEEIRLHGVAAEALTAYKANPTQATAETFNSALKAYDDYTDANTVNKADALLKYNTQNDLLMGENGLEAKYVTAKNNVLLDVEEFGDTYTPVSNEAAMAVTKALRPTFDEDQYKEVMGLEEDDTAALHYLENQAVGDEVIAQYTVQELGATLADLKSESSGFEGYVAGKDLALLREPISKLNAAGELEEVPSLYSEVIALDEVFSTSEIAKDMVSKLNLTKTNNLNSSISAITSMSPEEAAKINEVVDAAQSDKTPAEKLAEGLETIVGKDTFAYNALLRTYSALGDTVAGSAEFAGYMTDKIINAYKNDSEAGNNYWLQGLNLTDEDAVEVDPSTYGSDMVGRFVTYTQEQQEILLNQMGPRGKQFQEGSQFAGDVTLPKVVFKDVYGVMVPVGFEGDFAVENFTLGKNPTVYGYGLHAAEGLGDIALNVGLAFFGTKGLALGGAIDVAEAVGMSAIAIEEAVLEQLENPEYRAGAEYQDTLNNRAGGDIQKANALLLQDAKAFALYAGAVDGIADATMAKLIVKPLSLAGNKAINAGGNFTAASAAEVVGEVGQEFLNNAGLVSIDAIDVELGDGLAAAAIGALAEGSPGSGAALISSIVQDIRKDSANNGTIPPSGGQTATGGGPEGGAPIASVLNPVLSAAESDPTNILNAAVTNDVMLNAVYSLEGLDKLDTPITNAASLVSVLSTNGISDPETIAEIGNVVYNNDFVTKNEISNEIKLINPAFNPSEELSAQAYEQFGGNKSQAELDTLLGNFIDPYYFDRDEVKKAAESAGVVLTDEQADEYVGQVENEDDAANETVEALNSLVTNAELTNTVNAAVGSPATDDDAATGIYKELADLEAAGLSTNAKSDVEKLIGDVIGSAEEGTGVLGAIEGLEDLSEDEVKTIIEDVVGSSEDNTGLFGALAGLNNLSDQDVKDALIDYIGTPAGVDDNGNPLDATGLYADLGNLSTDIGDVADVLGNPAELDVDGNVVTEPTGVFANFAAVDTRLDTIDTVTTNLTNAIGAAAQLGVDSTGLYAYIDSAVQTLQDAGLTQEQVATTVTEIVGSPATDDAAATGVYAELGNLGLDLDSIVSTLGTPATDDAASTGLYGYIDTATAKLTEDISELSETVGDPAVLDEEGNVVEEATGVFADLATLEASGLTRDEAILQLATNLGLQTTTLTTAISDAEGRIRADIGKPAVLDEEGNIVDPSTGVFAGIDTAETRIVELVEQYEADGILRDEALDTAIGNVATDLGVTKEALLGEIGTTKTDLLNALGETETAITGQVAELGLDVDDIARTVGKPARDVTQEDIDLVTGAVEEETQLNAAQVAQFDVDGDGVITFADRDALIGYMSDTDPTQLAATGIYSELDTQTDAFTQLMNTLSTDITTQMTTAQADRDLKQRQSNISDFTQLLAGADDLQGQRTTVTTPDPIGDINPYNFESIFRDAGQAGRYTSPYGGTQATAAQEALDAAPPTQRGNMGMLAARLRGGFAQGGQVEDENDMLLRVLGEIR